MSVELDVVKNWCHIYTSMRLSSHIILIWRKMNSRETLATAVSIWPG